MSDPIEIVVADIGGTNARFALANIAGGRVSALASEVTFRTADYASLQSAWQAFAAKIGRSLPRLASLAVAAPIVGDVLKFINNPWIIQKSRLCSQLGLDDVLLVNDFAAVSYAVIEFGTEYLRPLNLPDQPLPQQGIISVIGPGTGLGVAHILHHGDQAFVIDTEGGHIDFAPLDSIEDAMLLQLRQRYRRVSVERVVSGPGLHNIFEALSIIEQRPVIQISNEALWAAALSGTDSLASAALERFCLCFGAIAGDIALAQGANAVVIAGGLAPRLLAILPGSGFLSRFTAKGRFETLMATLPIRLITHPQPGLFGAAAAYAQNRVRVC